jgi:hypothetical protein
MAAKEGLKAPHTKGLRTRGIKAAHCSKLAIKSPFEDNTGTTNFYISTRIQKD